MKSMYIGTKIVTAWQTDHVNQPGYAMAYSDGYISWSPKEVFELCYRAIEGDSQALTFGDALYMLKLGKCVARDGWNDEGIFLSMQRGSHNYVGQPGVMPSDIAGVDIALFDAGELEALTRMPAVFMHTSSGQIVTGWLASQIDVFASDWRVKI